MLEKKEFNTRKQLYWNTLLRIPVQAIVFVVSIIVTRILDPADFGIMAIVMMLIGYSNMLTNFGLNEAIIQKSISDNKILYSIFTFDILVSLILASIFFILSGHIARYFNTPECEEVIKVMSLVFISSTFYGVPNAILRRDMDFKSVSLFDAGRSISMSFITLVLAMQQMGYWALVYGQLIPLLIVTVLISIKTKFLPRIYFNYRSMKDIFHFGGWNFLKMQLQFIAGHVDLFIIGRWFNVSSLGFYDKAMTLSSAPYDTVTVNINGVMFSSFSAARNNKDLIQGQFKKSLTLITYLNFPMYLGLIVIVPYFVYSVLGDKWAPMITVFQIILAGFLLSSFSGVLASLIVGIGKYKALTIRLLIALIIFTISCFLLLRYNIEGIALSFLIFSIVTTTLWMDLAVSEINILWKEVYFSIKSGLLASMTMFAIVKVMALFVFKEYTVVNMICLILIGAFSYVTYVLLDKSELIEELKTKILNDAKQSISAIVRSGKD